MRFNLYIAEKLVGCGSLAVSQNGDANFFEGDGERDSKILAQMERARLDFVAANGIRLSGFSWAGKFDRQGCKVFRYVEWWMPYAEQPKGN